MKWDDLNFWQSKEWTTINDKLRYYDLKKQMYCPHRENLFNALDAVPFDDVRVVIMGQDPYPDPEMCTGIAFSVPRNVIHPDYASSKEASDSKTRYFPRTLTNFLEEYSHDLSLQVPKYGDLTSWCSQGVLLWNAIPTTFAFTSLTHECPEWSALTREIVQKLDDKGEIIFVLLGRIAKQHADWITDRTSDGGLVTERREDSSWLITASHPSPRASISSKIPFRGSRIFSRVNDILCSQGNTPINWRLQ